MSGKKAVRLLAGVLLVCCLIVGGPGGALAQLSVPTNGDGHEGLEPGEISLDKFAEPVEGTQNRWKVTLTLFGRGLAQSSDIVLLIDRSGSMGQSSGRMEAAKAAASQFVESLLTEENPETRIAVMSFASDVTTDTGFTDHTGKSSVLAAINGLSANGGTWTQKALREAHLLLSTSSADSKTIVLLSDGQPTYSYGLSSPSTDDFVKVGNEYHSRDDLPETAFVEDRVGTGSQIKTRVWPFSNYYYHHGNSAVAESRFAKDAGITVYAIGLTPGSEGKESLKGLPRPRTSITTHPRLISHPFSLPLRAPLLPQVPKQQLKIRFFTCSAFRMTLQRSKQALEPRQRMMKLPILSLGASAPLAARQYGCRT
ncbi:MAG: VWA domain-containing protein [Bacillota bacterium]